ncbi:MAG: methyltransferase domain-containing protein [Ruminococcus sp.]|nr:methyltransferase domain-containing protein [Ruminococcus sp.]
MGIYVCPVCGKNLNKCDNAYKCGENHSFDLSKSGYVNLLLSKHIGKTVHGDNKLMVKARRDFLDKGYYSGLKDALCTAAVKHFDGDVLLDAGCGEGYYTGAIYDFFNKQNIAADIYGIDISKIAVELAAKRYKSINFSAASVFHIPVSDSSADMLVTLFSPYCGEEFKRVLRKNGIMIMAIPSTDHLWEMKKAIYDTPYKNEVKPYELEGFDLVDKQRISYKIHLSSKDDIKSLFSMTPYYYRTGKEQQDRLYELDELDTTVDFELLVYRNK